MEANRRAEDEAFLRQFVFPEEDRHLFTSAPWRGGFRWFRSPNVVPIEFGRPLRAEILSNGGVPQGGA